MGLLTNLIPWWGRWLALAALLAAAMGFAWVKSAEHAHAADEAVMNAHLLQDQREAGARGAQHLKDEKAAADQYRAEAEAHAKESFRRVERQADVERTKDAAIHDANRRADALARELQQRPSRPTGDRAASGPSAGDGHPAPATSCTGAGLYLQDGDFLVREAARAQRVLTERDACHDKYDALTAPK
jgi:hypothetical protein